MSWSKNKFSIDPESLGPIDEEIAILRARADRVSRLHALVNKMIDSRMIQVQEWIDYLGMRDIDEKRLQALVNKYDRRLVGLDTEEDEDEDE